VSSILLRGIHVASSDRQAIRILRNRLAPEVRKAQEHKAERHKLYRMMLEAHHNHQELVREWRL
jgi:hypothetical protein